MGLIRRFFGSGPGELERVAQPRTTEFDQHEFAEEAPPSEEVSLAGKAPRQLVQRTLRETMAAHGIPRDWLDCRMLSTSLPGGGIGLHVQFRVRQGDQEILGYVHAFQDSFRQELKRADARSPEWLLSVAWEFFGKPDPAAEKPAAAFSDTQPNESSAQDLASDLAQLQELMETSRRP